MKKVLLVWITKLINGINGKQKHKNLNNMLLLLEIIIISDEFLFD